MTRASIYRSWSTMTTADWLESRRRIIGTVRAYPDEVALASRYRRYVARVEKARR